MSVTQFVAGAAFVVALAALILAVAVMRQSAETTADMRRHRRAHADAYGHPDPKLDRRQINLGAPRSVGERRGARYEPPAERLAPRPTTSVVTDEQLTPARADQIRADYQQRMRDELLDGSGTGQPQGLLEPPGPMPARPPDERPGPLGDPTGEPEQPEPYQPTTMLEAQRPDVPDVRDIRRRP